MDTTITENIPFNIIERFEDRAGFFGVEVSYSIDDCFEIVESDIVLSADDWASVEDWLAGIFTF